jgi:hypothetical protein
MTSPKPEPAGEQRLTWLVLLVALAAAAWLVQRARPRALEAPRLDLVSIVPNGPELLLTVDVESLGTAATDELLRAGGSALLGLREQCGFEPLLGLRRVAFATPQPAAGQAAGDFALIAETSLQQDPVLRCAEAVIRKRGGQPVRSTLGAFTSVRDQSKPLGEVAMRADGLFVMSGGQYFRDVIDAAGGIVGGDEAARLRTQVHVAMRRKLLPSQLVFTLIPGSTATLAGVKALGLGLAVKRELEVRGFVGCGSTAACGDARELALHLKDELARDSSVSGLASLSIVQEQQQLVVSGHLPRAQLAALLSQLIAP